uniref:BTB domain-containing protein n=1 Tax=Panagrolaimus superbus TaxID=310955 RepID=A0A914YUL8_9BILA
MFDTIIPNVPYSFCFQFVNKEFFIYVNEDGDEYLVKEMKCFIASANIQRFGDHFQIVTIAKREELFKPENNFFVDDILTIEIRGILCLETPNLNLLNNLWKKDDKDFTFVVGKKTVKAHKFIIRQCSAVFAAAIDSNSNEVKIENFEYNTVEPAVALCYDMDHYYSNMTGFEIIKFASTFDMPLIKN